MRQSSASSGWKHVTMTRSEAAATTDPRSFPSLFWEGWTTRASTRTPSPASKIAGARMKTAGKSEKARLPAGSSLQVGSSATTMASKDSVWRPKKLRHVDTARPPICAPYLHRFGSGPSRPAFPERPPPPPAPFVTLSDSRMQPAHVPHTGRGGRSLPSWPLPPWTKARKTSMNVSDPAMIFMVVDSPPGITSASQWSSSWHRRTCTISSLCNIASGIFRNDASCSANAPCSAKIPNLVRVEGACGVPSPVATLDEDNLSAEAL
mmetsp:Transcript_65592/g.128976  ORF Transcript_65592/g.128976 Transcript_65592/m.128976 type:complete len:264 (+) Transcript_65592:220-1011(+)